MPVFSSKMTLFGKAGLYTIIGMVSFLGSTMFPWAIPILLWTQNWTIWQAFSSSR